MNKTKRILRLLVIDDSPDDADALAKSLRIARFMLKTKRVSDAAGLQGALTNSKWDVVICEHKLHSLKSRNAFELVRGNNPDLPFIIYTSNISDEETIDLMNSGIRDVIHKSRNARIVPVISRELRVLEEKKEHLRAIRATKEIEDKHRTMVEGSHEAVAYMLDGLHVEVNHAYLSLFGYEKFAELEILPVLDLIDKASQANFKSALRKTNKNIKLDGPVELTARKKDDSIINLEATLAPVDLKGEKCIQITVSDVSKRKAAENRLQYLSQRDPLTGLYNRHHFVRLLDEAIHSAKKNTGVLLYINLYDLKNIIQSLGYTAGDRMLLKITKLLRDTLGSDTELARLGSDDFAVIYKDKNQADGTRIAQKLEKVITKSPISEKGENYFCHFISSITPLSGSENALSLLTQAQTACEQDKPEVSIPEPKPATQPAQDTNVVPFAETNEQPDNRIELEQEPVHLSIEKTKAKPTPAPKTVAAPTPEPEPVPEPTPKVAAHSGDPVWQARIATALTNNSFRLAYQPMINLHGEPEEYYEVLVRMMDETGRLLLPGEFMPQAEQTNQLKEIDRWVILRSIEALSAMHSEGREATFFINLSHTAFEDEKLAPLVKQYIDASGVNPRHCVFELDEDVISKNLAIANELIGDLSDVGCPISIDNFGMNVSVLLNLPRHTVRYVKVNSSDIEKMGETSEDEELDSSLAMIEKLEISKVAKCVEDAASLSILWTRGFEYVQGNYFQGAETETNYDFSGEDETTLSSDDASASWSN